MRKFGWPHVPGHFLLSERSRIELRDSTCPFIDGYHAIVPKNRKLIANIISLGWVYCGKSFDLFETLIQGDAAKIRKDASARMCGGGALLDITCKHSHPNG